MSDEYHDQWGTPLRHPPEPATSDSLNRPPRSREAVAIEVAREGFRYAQAQAGIPNPIEACRQIIATCERTLDRMAIILGDGP